MRRVHLISTLIMALAISCSPAWSFDVVKDGKPKCSLVLSPIASPSARLAAEELNGYIKKMSGAELPILTELPGIRADHQTKIRHESEYIWQANKRVPGRTKKNIWKKAPSSTKKANPTSSRGIVIGTIDSLTPIPTEVRKRLAQCESNEAFYIKSDKNNIFIIGKKPIGALYGTYTLLEEYLGVRWLHPGDLGESYPSKANLSLPRIDDFQKPDMSIRVQRGGRGPHYYYDVVMWRVRNKMQVHQVQPHRWFEPGNTTKERAEFLSQALNAKGQQRGGHLTWKHTVPDELFKEHPEYFPLKNGKRVHDKTGVNQGTGYQRCVSNPEVFKLVADYILDWCSKNPDNSFTLDACDSRNSWCECTECRKMGTVNGKFKITNLYHKFASKVVNNVLKRNPEAKIQVLFYIDKCFVPDDKSISYSGKNVKGCYCTCWPYSRCYAHKLTDPNCKPNKACLANMLEILKICPTLYTFEYLCNSNIEYVPVWKTTAQDIKDMATLGIDGYMDIVHGYKWRARWLSLYLGAKLHWNTKLNPEKLRDEAYAYYYGAAATEMKKYHDLRLKLWENAPGHAFYPGPQRNAYCLTVPGAEEELKAYLKKAKQLIGNDKKVMTRINLDEQYLEDFWKKPADKLKKRFSADKQVVPERVRNKIVIDGNLNEDTWVAARPVTGFLKLNTEQEPIAKSNFRVAYDQDNLYIGFTAMNDKAWGPEIANETQRDGKKIWKDDHIEFQLAPPNKDEKFYHFVVNTNGAFYDSAMIGQSSDLTHDSKAEVKVQKLKDRFIYEIRLPLAPMNGNISPGTTWGIYAMRTAKNLQPPNNKENSSLDGTSPHRVLEFRQATFGNNIIKNANLSNTTTKKKRDYKGIVGDKWLKDWGVNAQEAEVLLEKARPNRLRIKDGVIYSYLKIKKSASPRTITGEIQAKGEGQLSVRLSTCIRPAAGMDRGKRYKQHSIRKDIDTFELSEHKQALKFTANLAPYEEGYIYIRAKDEAIISNVSATLIEE